MASNKILILEDSQSRLTALHQAISQLDGDFSVRVWNNAPQMLVEFESYLPEARLITLDWHLRPISTPTPGTGFDVMRRICKLKPTAPVIVHSSAILESTIMRDELRSAGWRVEQVLLMQNEQVLKEWLPVARMLLNG